MSLFMWIIISVIVILSLFLIVHFDGKSEELRENVVFPDGSLTNSIDEALTLPQQQLEHLNKKLNIKANRLQMSRDKVTETKNTISELEVTSDHVQSKYGRVLKQLKTELAKTESACQYLHSQIEQIATQRDQIKIELEERQSQIPISLDMYSSPTRYRNLLRHDTFALSNRRKKKVARPEDPRDVQRSNSSLPIKVDVDKVSLTQCKGS